MDNRKTLMKSIIALDKYKPYPDIGMPPKEEVQASYSTLSPPIFQTILGFGVFSMQCFLRTGYFWTIKIVNCMYKLSAEKFEAKLS